MRDFNGRVAAITGAGSGIGRALATALAAEACHLALSDINPETLAETVDTLAASGVKITSRVLSTADREAVHAWADDTAAEHGKVNMIFNNAGVSSSGTVEAMSYEDWDWLLSINLNGVVHGTKAFLPHLREAGEGHVVNVSSILGIASQTGLSAYCTAKFGVRGFTESLRQEMELTDSPIGVTCVHPGGIKTNIARDGRVDRSMQAITGRTAEESKKEFEKSFINTPERAARDILRAVRANRPRVLVGGDARLIDWIVRHFPVGYRRFMLWMTRRRLVNSES